VINLKNRSEILFYKGLNSEEKEGQSPRK